MNDTPHQDGLPALPERDRILHDKAQGIYRKFEVRRTDGSDQPGDKHEGCEYFVLDVTHDPYAIPALTAYAKACEDTHQFLAADLRDRYSLAALPLPVQGEEVPDDFHSHKAAWLAALVIARDAAKVQPPDVDDRAYWDHEIAAFNRAYDQLAAHPKAQPASPERKPLTDEQISKGCNYAIELSNEIERAAFRKGVKFAEDAHRIAATQEPRT